MTYFLLRDYNILPKKELHWSPWVAFQMQLHSDHSDGSGVLCSFILPRSRVAQRSSHDTEQQGLHPCGTTAVRARALDPVGEGSFEHKNWTCKATRMPEAITTTMCSLHSA